MSTVTSFHTSTVRGDHCPSCERFIGPAGRCPYCGEDAARAPALRYLRLAAFLLAFLGLAGLYVSARHRDLPVVRIASITPMMNFAYVRVIGCVVREPRVNMRDGRVESCSFLVDDGSGALRVQAYSRAAEHLAAEHQLPRAGSVVDVAGSLSVAAESDPKLRLHVAEQLRVLTNPVVEKRKLKSTLSEENPRS